MALALETAEMQHDLPGAIENGNGEVGGKLSV